MDDKSKLAKKLDRWQDFEKFSDFQIKIGKEVFKVHKALLASKSPFIEQLFKTDQHCSMELTDCEPNSFKIFLNYLYSSQIEDKDISSGLLYIANKFKMKLLVEFCEEKLCNLSWENENVVNLLLVAITSGCARLKRKCALYIKKNLENVKKKRKF